MPQLWTETYVSQYFWLIVILCVFNFLFVNNIVPAIAKNIKARKRTSIVSIEDKEEEITTINVTLPVLSMKTVDSKVSFIDSRETWMNKQK